MKAFSQKNKYFLGFLSFSLILMIIIFCVFSVDDATNKMIVEYTHNLGWQINPSPFEISHLTIPQEFDEVYEAYNKVQKASGFDLSSFKGKRVTRYTYELQNHVSSEEEKVLLGILVYESRIIAGDISSISSNGFMHGITEISKIKNP